MNITSYVRITSSGIDSDRPVPQYDGTGSALLTSAFKALATGYAKFYKMDTLSKLGFLASEILLAGDEDRFTPREDRAVVMMNSSSSVCDDRHYQESIRNPEAFFPSPALFVYTLPNIVTGEIAIRNKYFGETSFYVLPSPDPVEIARLVGDAFRDRMTRSVLGGWLECTSDDDFEAVVFLVEPETNISETSIPETNKTDVNELDINKLNVDDLNVNKLNIGELNANESNINKLNINGLDINGLDITKPNINGLNINESDTTKPNINKLNITKLNINELNRIFKEF